jgi:uncharacterized phage-associated protein
MNSSGAIIKKKLRWPKMVRALDLAKLFMVWANRDGDLITNLKMQKLLYYAQAWYLVNFNKPIFSDLIEAWPLGPVIPEVYHRFKSFGAAPIVYSPKGEIEDSFTQNQLKFLVDYFKVYIGASATDLVNLSHNEKPWKSAIKKGKGTVIKVDVMQQYYSDYYAKYNDEKKQS